MIRFTETPGTIFKAHQSGSGTTSGGAGSGAWEDLLSVNIDLGTSTRTVRATGVFQCFTGGGPAAAWDANFRITIAGNAGSTFTRRLSGTADNGLGSALHVLDDQTGIVTVVFQAQDDNVRAISCNPLELCVEGY